MNNKEYRNILLERFLNNTISKSEFDELIRYIDTQDSEDEIKKMMNQHWEDINVNSPSKAMSLSQNNELLESLLEKIEGNKPVKKMSKMRVVSKWYSIAALIMIFFTSGYFYYSNFIISDNHIESISNTLPEVITLRLDNGEVKVISEEENEQIINAQGLVVGTQKGNLLAYENNISEGKLSYNTLTVPYGKRFQLVLSDGTKVHLNAGTSLKYPVKFLHGMSREVFLDGEAFFDVVKDTKHPFLVNSKDINIKVLGTKFNVTSYPEDYLINAVLIEGSVEVSQKDNNTNLKTPTILKPGYKASWNKQSKNITTSKVDTERYTAWMEGRLILNEVPFKNIQTKLERQYNVTFINNNESLKERKFTARFDIENINQVMKSLSISAGFKYELSNNQIIIN